MNNLTDKEILKIYSNYTNCRLCLKEPDEFLLETLKGVNFNSEKVHTEYNSYNPKDVKLILDKLEDITDDDVSILSVILCPESLYKCTDLTVLGKSYIKNIIEGDFKTLNLTFHNIINAFEFLKSKYYDLPLIRIGDKNFCLIDSGIAIDRKTLNNTKGKFTQEKLIAYFNKVFSEQEVEYSTTSLSDKDVKFYLKHYSFNSVVYNEWAGRFVLGPQNTIYENLMFAFGENGKYLGTGLKAE